MKQLFWLIACLPAALGAAHLQPWTGRDLEIISQAELGLSSNALFLDLSARTSYIQFSGEFEANFAHSKYQRGLEGDALALTGRYQLSNDVIGDPLSAWVGITARKVFTNGLHDPTCFYHGGVEGELHGALGKEWSCEQFWTRRIWGYTAIGFADLGRPWLSVGAAWERNWWDINRVALFLESEKGFGAKKLHKYHFKGYGPVRYAYLQFGAKYAHQWEFGGIGEVALRYRPLAKHCPKHWLELRLAFVYPFGL